MLYLVLAVLCSMLVSVVMRISEKYSRNSVSRLATNYIMCCVVAGAFAGGPTRLFPKDPGLVPALAWGVLGGVLFLACFLLLQATIARSGLVLPTTFMKLGVIVPVVLSVLFFGESPRAVQAVGLVLAVAAILILGGKGHVEKKDLLPLIALLLVGGFADSMTKIYGEVGSPALSDQFLFYIFFSALILCLVLCAVKKQPITWADAGFGLAIGVPNYLSSRFLFKALDTIPAVVAHPSYSVGTIVLVALVGFLAFREKPDRRKAVALVMILAALVLLNL